MTAIHKILRLDHPGVLRDFSWPAEMPAFGRFNLIYGWNGSGKTTISRILRNLERGKPPAGIRVTLSIRGRNISEAEFSEPPIQVRTFNSDFVNETVFRVDAQEMPPIFVVGKDSVEKQQKLDGLRTEQSQKAGDLQLASINLEKANRTLDKYRIESAREIKLALRVPGLGPYHEYDKSAYSSRVREMSRSGDTDTLKLDRTTQDRLLTQYRATIKPPVEEVPYVPPSLGQLRDEVLQVCLSTVASSVIRALERDPPLGEWVRQGLRLHDERHSRVCLFCEQNISEQRLELLEAHFSTEYERFLGRIDALLTRLRTAADRAKFLDLPDSGLLYDDLSTDYQVAREALEKMKTDVHVFVSDLISLLEEKRNHPFRKLDVGVAVPEIDLVLVIRLNDLLSSHNRACEYFKSRVDDAGRRLADGMIASSLAEHTRLLGEAKDACDSISPIDSEVRRLNDEITRLEQEIIEHLEPAEELNEDLHQYLGHDEVRLEVRDTGYVLTRRGEPAQSLSEGERTALALLYFLKSLRDRRFNMSQGVVVLDDPVSSLDSNSLYLAVGFIRERTQDAAQLFLLTHNFTFFREIRNWFKHTKGQNNRNVERRPAKFYMLEHIPGSNPRTTIIRALDRLLEQFDSEYHYLFSCVYHETHSEVPADLEHSYLLPNVAQRLLETFLAFRRPQNQGPLREKMNDVAFDPVKKTRILRFVNAHSHAGAIGEPEHDQSLLGETRAVLANLLEFMRSQDSEHFDAMVELVDTGEVPDAIG